VEQHTPYNHFGHRKRPDKRVMIFIQRDIGKQKTRRQVSEHPFGAIKRADALRHFLCRRREITTAEFVLGGLSCNLRRAINLAGGVPALIERFKAGYQGMTATVEEKLNKGQITRENRPISASSSAPGLFFCSLYVK